MKGFLVALLLLAFIIFNPTSTLARVVKEEKYQTGDPNKPVCNTNGSYRSCIPPKAPATPCNPYDRNCH
ncbi:hypothetical protein Fmac_017392 [Flemingia macrophylla]|uniref:Uncharacterized protein n=1 Tax=Flemingia macrophylla TaxID=520843 RepID=A0ABD1M262_9FABA